MSFTESGAHGDSEGSPVAGDLQQLFADNRMILDQISRERDAVTTLRKQASSDSSVFTEQCRRQQEQIEAILSAQVEESRQKAARDKVLTKIAAIAVAAIVPGGAGGLYMLSRSPSPDQIRLQAKPVLESVEASNKQVESRLTKRVEESEAKIQKLGEAVIEQQVQISDGFDFIADKIDAAHPRQKDAVDIGDYPTVEAARKKADSIKMRKGVEKLFSEDGEEW